MYIVRACLPHTLQKTSGPSCGVSGQHAFQTISLSPDASLHLQPQGGGNPLHTLSTYVCTYVSTYMCIHTHTHTHITHLVTSPLARLGRRPSQYYLSKRTGSTLHKHTHTYVRMYIIYFPTHKDAHWREWVL